MLRQPGEARDQALAVRILIRQMLESRLGQTAWTIPMTYAETGQPLLDAPVPLHISLSHADGFVAAAFGTAGPLGVDVETARNIPATPELLPFAQRFFSAEEYRDIAALTDEDRGQEVLALWTAKEAIAKAAGLGLGLPFRASLIGPPLVETENRHDHIRPVFHSAQVTAVRTWRLETEAALSLAAAGQDIQTLAAISLS